MHKERGAEAAAALKRRGSTSMRFNSTTSAASDTGTWKKKKRRRSSSYTATAWQCQDQHEIDCRKSDSVTTKHNRRGAAAAATLKQLSVARETAHDKDDIGFQMWHRLLIVCDWFPDNKMCVWLGRSTHLPAIPSSDASTTRRSSYPP